MFTLEQINQIHEMFGRTSTLPKYLQALNAVGIDICDSYLADGHSEYFGKSGEQLSTSPIHERFTVAERSNRKKLLKQLELHKQQKTSYLEMSKGLADSGIEKWTFDTNAMTLTYYDKAGSAIFTENI